MNLRAGRTLSRVRSELALARALTPAEFAAVKGLRSAIHMPAYVRTLLRLEEKLTSELNKSHAGSQNTFEATLSSGPACNQKPDTRRRNE